MNFGWAARRTVPPLQAAHKKLGVTPLAVHATYSLDNHDGLAKAQRFRESGLWRVDPPGYFEGKYLALNSSISPALQAAARSCERSRA